MNSLMLLDWMGDFVSQLMAQCQFWCWMGVLAVAVALFVCVGVATLQVLETLDRNDAGPAIRH